MVRFRTNHLLLTFDFNHQSKVEKNSKKYILGYIKVHWSLVRNRTVIFFGSIYGNWKNVLFSTSTYSIAYHVLWSLGWSKFHIVELYKNFVEILCRNQFGNNLVWTETGTGPKPNRNLLIWSGTGPKHELSVVFVPQLERNWSVLFFFLERGNMYRNKIISVQQHWDTWYSPAVNTTYGKKES